MISLKDFFFFCVYLIHSKPLQLDNPEESNCDILQKTHRKCKKKLNIKNKRFCMRSVIR